MIFNPLAIDTVIRCPKCASTDWRCWDERTFDCFDQDGNYAGAKVVGYLQCKLCEYDWCDVSFDPGPDCDCED